MTPSKDGPDISKAKKLLAWEPKVSRSVGLGITLDYFKSLPKDELYKEPKEFLSK
jgi:dTDP-glucose 4,6-dehydratase